MYEDRFLYGAWANWNYHPGRETFKEERPCKPFSDFRDEPFDFDLFYETCPEFEPVETTPLTATVDVSVFANTTLGLRSGVYTFRFRNAVWQSDAIGPVVLLSYGITTYGSPVEGAAIVVNYTEAQDGQPARATASATQGSTAIFTRSFIAAAAKQSRMFVRNSWCRELDGADRLYALNLCTAHVAIKMKQSQVGLPGTSRPLPMGVGGGGYLADTMPGVMTSASVGGVSVSKTGCFQPRSFWEAWFNETPYGRQLLVFLSEMAVAPLFYEGEDNIGNCLRD